MQVHYVVQVPAGAEVKFTTVNGGIELTGLKGRINAETTNGGIKARDVTGSIDASTTNGGVEVELAAVGEAGREAGLHERRDRAAAAVRLEGDDLGARRERRHRHERAAARNDGNPSRRHLEGRLNGGGPRIDLEGVNGGIRIAAAITDSRFKD